MHSTITESLSVYVWQLEPPCPSSPTVGRPWARTAGWTSPSLGAWARTAAHGPESPHHPSPQRSLLEPTELLHSLPQHQWDTTSPQRCSNLAENQWDEPEYHYIFSCESCIRRHFPRLLNLLTLVVGYPQGASEYRLWRVENSLEKVCALSSRSSKKAAIIAALKKYLNNKPLFSP